MSFEARLCREILEEEFGPFVAKVSHQLLLRGRMTLFDVTRFTQLPQRQVRECLVVLIQHGLAYFTESLDGKKEPTYYQVDPRRVLLRLRMASIMRVTEDTFGKEGLAICRLIFTEGRITLKGFHAWLSANEKNLTNAKKANYTKAFTKMAARRYITAVLPEHSRSMMDRFLSAEEKEAEKYTIATAKDLQAIKRAAQAQVDAEYGSNENIGMKRKAHDPMASANKRSMLDGPELGTKDVDEDVEVNENVYFSINYDKYTMIFRNDSIVNFATERINRTAGQVVQAFLDYGQDKMKIVQEEDSPSATPMHIANILTSKDISGNDIILQPDPLNPGKKPSFQEAVKGYITLLKMDQAGFIKSKDERGANHFSINFAKLRETTKRKLLEALIRERYGVATCRIVRILIEKGKLDESQVQKLGMLPPKDTRDKLGLLLTKGFVEIQEVPRSADRAPARSFHLWYVPLEKCYQELLVETYRVIGNLQQRKKEELKIRSRLLDKLNREDVKQNMDLLSEGDKAEIAQMDKVLQRLESSKMRLDEVIMILRDF